MTAVAPVTLEGNGVRLAPLEHGHAEGLRAAARDGALGAPGGSHPAVGPEPVRPAGSAVGADVDMTDTGLLQNQPVDGLQVHVEFSAGPDADPRLCRRADRG